MLVEVDLPVSKLGNSVPCLFPSIGRSQGGFLKPFLVVQPTGIITTSQYLIFCKSSPPDCWRSRPLPSSSSWGAPGYSAFSRLDLWLMSWLTYSLSSTACRGPSSFLFIVCSTVRYNAFALPIPDSPSFQGTCREAHFLHLGVTHLPMLSPPPGTWRIQEVDHQENWAQLPVPDLKDLAVIKPLHFQNGERLHIWCRFWLNEMSASYQY